MLDERLDTVKPDEASATALEVSPVMARFDSCRWRKAPEGSDGAHCTHREVLPLAGVNGFRPEAWCPDCTFYKLRRGARRPHGTGGAGF